jgi:membrane protease YdiL (CAAX protease family)
MGSKVETRSPLTKGRAAAALRIAFVVLCVLMAEWVLPSLLGPKLWAFDVPIIVIVAFGFLTHRALDEKVPELGFRLDNFFHAARLLAPPMLLIIVALLIIGYAMGSLGMPRLSAGWQLLQTVLWLFWWGLLQQYALQAIINRQAQKIWGKGSWSLFAVALIFAALHLPNAPLVLATFVGGCVWAFVYQRAPNLLALALSHCIMTLALVWTLPPSLLHGLRVGAGYQ